MKQQVRLDFLMRDVLASFPDKVYEHLVEAINNHMIALESTIRVFSNEGAKKKPDYRILNGCLTVLDFRLGNGEIFCAMDVLQNIKTCLKDERKTIRRLASKVLIRLALSLRFEFILLPLPPSDAKSYLEKFKKVVNKEDLNKSAEILRIFKDNKFFGKFIFEHHGAKFDVVNIEKTKNDFKKILDELFT